MKFVVEAIGTKSGGGVEVTRSLLRGLARRARHQIVALLPDIPDYEGIDAVIGRVVRFPERASLLERHAMLNGTVPRICREEQADALLCLGNFLPAEPPCPTVGFLQNAWYVYDEPVAWRRLTLRERLIVLYGRHLLADRSQAAHMVVQTAVMKERLASVRGGGLSGITVIPTAPSLLGSHPRPQSLSRASEGFTFLCISRYAAHKNFEILIDAAKFLRKRTSHRFRCLLTIAPDQHPRARQLLRRIASEGLDRLLVNVGPVAREKLAETYAAADAHLLPTLLETFGITYDEAMHFGLPILTSDRDFARERCQGAALYFDPLCAKSVADAMAKIIEDAELRRRLVENGRRIVSNSPTWDDIAAQFEKVLERAAVATPAPGEGSQPKPLLVQADERSR